jgi:phenylacetic acid degradation operon negative regulatory protein
MSAPSPTITPRLVVEGLVRRDGTVSLDEAYAVANAVGIADQRLRLTVSRLVAEGRFVKAGRGRGGTLSRTARADLEESHDLAFVAFAYAQDRGEVVWDGAWTLLSVSVPEQKRVLRDQARRTLLRLGAALLPGGVYLSPHAISDLIAAEAPALASQSSLIVARSVELVVGGVRDPRRIAASAWPLDEVADRHRQLLDVLERPPDLAGPKAELGRALVWANAFESAHRLDPLLPPELLPAPWVGAAARSAFAAAWRTHRIDLPLFERFRDAVE